MTTTRPPRLVIALLNRLRADREPLVGDLLEEFEQGRSRWWLWHQTLSIVTRDLTRLREPLGLGLETSRTPSREACPVLMRGVGGIGSRHVGGLGALASAILMTLVAPGIWLVLLAAVAGGIALGVGLVQLRRHWTAGLALFVLSASIAAQERARPAVPIDPVAGILNAFASHQVVTLPGGFGTSRQALLERLMRDERFPGVVNDIVVEFGSSRYQDAMDRYIRGEDVAYEDLRHAWQDTTSPTGNDSPQVEAFYRTVREINATLPEGRRVRVLLGEPPMDWDQVRTKQDHRKWIVIRDLHVGDLIRREVAVRGRRALVIYGQLHYPRKEILTNYDMTNWQAQTLVSWLESMSVSVFNVWATGTALVRVQPDSAKWPHMSLTLVRGTTLGAADFTAFDPGTGKDRFVIRGQDDFAPISSDQFRTMRMDDQFDAILYTGGGPPEPPLPRISPKACAETGYLKMRLTRIAIAGLPPGEAAGIEKACAGAR